MTRVLQKRTFHSRSYPNSFRSSKLRAAVVSSSSLSMRASNMHSHCEPRLNAAARLKPIMSKLSADESDLTTRVAIARFGAIRARFNKRSMSAFPKADHRSDI
jgi:hypothetical protein